MSSFSLFATCPRGLETVLAAELAAQGCTAVRTTDGGASCRGGRAQIYRANLHSRTAGRILLQLAEGAYRSEDDVRRLAQSIAWPQWFDVAQTFKVHTEGRRARVQNIDFVSLKIKDGICDRFRSDTGSRPSIDKARPDIRIRAFLDDKSAKIFIDTSGEALFKRGYRSETGEAPLRENLAAGLLLLAGYDGSQPFQDPFCGSGTIAVEAAWIAQNRAPGLLRRFGFEAFKGFQAALWQQIRDEARRSIRPAPCPIAATDHDPDAVRTARTNLCAAGISNTVGTDTADVCATRPNGTGGLLLSNPPYGGRLSDTRILHALYPQLGSWLKQHYAGWQIGMFTADRDMPKLMRLSPKRKIPLYNGKLDCRLFLLDMVAGSNR